MIDSNELAKKVRIHKHNYAGEFGNIVVDPIGKETMVPQIRNNCLLLKKIISKERHFSKPYLIETINWANSYTDDLCNKLNHIEDDDKGEAKPISIINIIEKEFEEDREIRTRMGYPSFECSIYGRRGCSDIKVFLDPDGFKKNVIDNIIQNIHKHAFSDDTNITPIINQIPWWKRLWLFLLRKKSETLTHPIIDRQVQIKFFQEEPEFVKVVIENNGNPFTADMDPSKIFEYGVSNGSGDGIGLYSAADFLRKFGSTIEAESTPNDKFTVHFSIKIPVYGKQV